MRVTINDNHYEITGLEHVRGFAAPKPMHVESDTADSPFAPGYGYPDTYRKRAVRRLKEHGHEVACREFGASRSAIYSWARAFGHETPGGGKK